LYRSLREYGEKDLAARYESELRKYAGRLNYR
jgi:hypothetical protein